MKAPLIPMLLLLTAAACHCDKNEPEPIKVCGVVDPVENLAWLKAIIDDYKKDTNGMLTYQYVQQSTYEGNTVFIFGNCCPVCDFVPLIKDCEGNTVEISPGGELGPNTVIWKPENSSCVFTQ
jgi:hypothetical protein